VSAKKENTEEGSIEEERIEKEQMHETIDGKDVGS
jgi:hypothetical protein